MDAAVAVTAGFEFDVAVRFDTDELPVTLDIERLGSITSIPLVEIVEGEAPPAYPVGRDRLRLTLLAFAASLLLGVALVVLIELLAGGVRPGRRPQVAG